MREGESQKKPETEIKGFSVSKGIAHGEAFVLLHKELQTPVYEVRDADKPAEIKRFENAILKTRKDILDVKSELSEEIGSAEASIFDAHILVLEDVAVMQETLSMFKENNYNIEYCYSSVINKFIAAFERIDDPYIKERIADFKDVSRRVLGNMLGVQTSKIGALSDPLILVSSDFAPADFSLVDKSKILAIVTEKGSQTSHTAILSRSLGIPCVVGIPEVAKKVSTGDMLLIDGYNGSIVINPSESTVSHYTELESAQKEIEVLYATSLPYPSVTPDGRAFSVEINISSPADISESVMRYCDGVGLFRTENFFMDFGGFPDEESQFKTYRDAALAARKTRRNTYPRFGRGQKSEPDENGQQGGKPLHGLSGHKILPRPPRHIFNPAEGDTKGERLRKSQNTFADDKLDKGSRKEQAANRAGKGRADKSLYAFR